MSLFTLDHVSRHYTRGGQTTRALDDVSLAIDEGTQLGVVGESGSGKTTLIRMLTGLDRPTRGQVLFRGQPVTSRAVRPQLASQVQVVFQDPRSSLDPRMRVRRIVTEPLRSRLLRRAGDAPTDHGQRFGQVMGQVGLDPDWGDRFPHEFSGGQRQRIAIARALAPRPSVLIGDEPVSALDVSVRAQILNVFTELIASQDITLLMVSHDLGVIRHVCDRVVVLRAGQIVEDGPVADIFDRPQHPYTAELIAAMPTLPTPGPNMDDDGLAGPAH
ncbi:ABC transporter ATP-binding protein [Tessaracoccus sp. SD287]|uniref:ABC transporter ATP-binding protein n=1 Tax=Tessaracoccus sp. SD287 TaxID=2782008 RepID=UPI001A96072D|nr:ABC transporter ATP-binding protein [Tessaracoccus sp. SD287]